MLVDGVVPETIEKIGKKNKWDTCQKVFWKLFFFFVCCLTDPNDRKKKIINSTAGGRDISDEQKMDDIMDDALQNR